MRRKIEEDVRREYEEKLRREREEDEMRRKIEADARRKHDVHEGLQSWLDASKAGAVTTDGDGRVIEWQDVSGNGLPAVGDGQAPQFVGEINGLPAVNFRPGDTLKAARGCRVRTVVLVAQHRTVCDCMMLFSEYRDKDFSIRTHKARGPRSGGDGNDWQHGKASRLFVNGDNRSHTWHGFPIAPVVIIAEKRDGRGDGDDFVYQLSSRFMGRGFDGLIGEVMVYNRALSQTEVQNLQRYLGTKWRIEVRGISDPKQQDAPKASP
jgi:hypothetical protein